MAKSLTSAPATGMGNSPAIQSTHSQGSKALTTSRLCFALALLTMATTSWFVVEGIQATEPESSARWAKVASGVLLLILEAAAFGLAGQWPEHRKVLRPLGWSILALEITLMSVSQISIGLTAGKAASNGAGTMDEIRAQAKESRAAAEALRADAEKLRKSKHGWLQEQAAKKSGEAAEQSKSAAAAVASLEKSAVLKVSTPIVEIVGQGGLIALSVALSLALSLSGIALMHVAGSLRRRADGALPVDQQILELLHKIHGGPAPAPAPAPEHDRRGSPDPVLPPVKERRPDAPAPAPAAAGPTATQAPFTFLGFKKVPAAPVSPTPAPAPAPAVASFKPAGTVAPTGLSFGKATLAGAGTLAALSAAPMVQAAPAPVHEKAPAVPAERVNDDMAERVNDDTPAPMKTGVSAPVNGALFTSAERVNDDTPEHVNDDTPAAPAKARKERVARDGAVMDSGTGPLDGFRYRRGVAGVKAGKIQPTYAGMYEGLGVTAPTAKRFLEAMTGAGVVVRKGNRYALAEKYRAKLVKKGGAK